MRYRFIAAAVAATAIAATAALTGAGMASASTTVTGTTSESNVPDTTNASGPACLTTVNGSQWANDQFPSVSLSATELTSPANTWNVTITSDGSFKGFADPTTCAALVSAGNITGSIQYTVTSATAPAASGLKADYAGETEFSTLITDFFGGSLPSTAISGGDIYNYSYQGGNYTQVGTEGGGLVITGDVVASTAVVPDVVGQRVNPAESAIQAAGFKVVTNVARNPLDTYVVTGQSAVGKTALGTTVTLKIALTTKSVTVPKVIGQRANPGLATIRAAGLMAVTNPLRKSTGSYVITSESPAAGTKVTPGAKIVVGVKLVS